MGSLTPSEGRTDYLTSSPNVAKLRAEDHRLLTVARALVSARSVGGSAAPFFVRDGASHTTLAGVSPRAMVLLEQTLAKGCIHQLLLRGGWQRSVSIDAMGQPRWGRSWERHRPLRPLRFSAASFELLRWLAICANDSSSSSNEWTEWTEWTERTKYLATGDELLTYLALDIVSREPRSMEKLASTSMVHRSILAWLGFPEIMAGRRDARLDGGSVAPFIADGGDVLIESLTMELSRRWVSTERGKSSISEPDELEDLGRAQQVVLEVFLDAIDALGRRDLASFLVDAAVDLLPPVMTPREAAAQVRGSLSPRTTLAKRRDALRAAGAFMRAVSRIGQWNEEHRYTRAFDAGYERSQALLTRWESLGPHGFHRVAAALRELETVDSALSR